MDLEYQQLWQAVLGRLELVISKPSFATWFKGTSVIDKAGDKIMIGVPNGFSKEWLKNKYHTEILKAVRSISPEVREIQYQIVSQAPAAQQAVQNSAPSNFAPAPTVVINQPNTATAATHHVPAAGINGINPKYTFSNFIIGNGNDMATAACQAVVSRPGTVYNPLFLYGGVGLGKTHLMQAIGNEILGQRPKTRILYVSSERFSNEFIQAIEKGKMSAFKELYRNVDVLLIDDIQFLAGKERFQEEFFHTFNHLQDNNKQIVMTSDRLPTEIHPLEERLVSRFQQGMVADVQPPDLETRLAILKTKAREKNYDVPSEVLMAIAEIIKSNIRELEGALNRLMVFCQLNNIIPTVEQAKSILAATAPKKKTVTTKKLVDSVANFYNVTLDDLIKQSRKKEFVKPRQIAMYLIRKEMESSFPSIGDFFGGRDHTTVMHAVEKIENLVKEKENIRQEIELILDKAYT